MQIVLRDDNTEQFNVFLTDVQFDCDEESGYQEPMSNVFMTVEAKDLAAYETVDCEDILLACLSKLSDQTGFCVNDLNVDRIVYVDTKFNERLSIKREAY
jgi:hypothetical protein